MQKVYKHVEDYIELLDGSEPGQIFTQANVTIRLASYDNNVVESLASHTLFGGSLTDRQAELALKLITTYQRQLAKHGIDIGTILENPQYRQPLRTINRSKEIWIDNDQLYLRFPYDKQLINQLHSHRKTSLGAVKFQLDEKVWQLDLTESNVNWAVAFGQLHEFAIDKQAQDLFDKIVKCGDTLYAIELIPAENGYTITNAANSLIEYIEQHGGFGYDNLIKLIDMAAVLGYTVSEKIDVPLLLSAFEKRVTHLTPSVDQFHLDMIFEYAELTNRWPVCIFDPSATLTSSNTGTFEKSLERFGPSEIVQFDHNGKTKTCEYNPQTVKVIYARKIPKTWNHSVPLLVSTIEMMFGGKRMEWLQTAEKVIFYCSAKLNN